MNKRKMKRSQLLDEITRHITRIELAHPVRVAIDGVDAAGKTTLANELVEWIEGRGRPVIRASIDGFHNPTRIRHARGRSSPEGYYHDSFNYEALLESLLVPLGPNGSRLYCSKIFDYRTDKEMDRQVVLADINAVLLFDGVFLLRPEICEHWDCSIFVEAPFDVILQRALVRDCDLNNSSDDISRRYKQRYIPGQKIYLEAWRPEDRAEIVVRNSDPNDPVALFPGA